MVEAESMLSADNPHQKTADSQESHQWGVTSLQAVADREQALERNKVKLLTYIRENVIGSQHNTLLHTVFGDKPHVYCDYTASGKSLRFIEDYIINNVMPLYANTHSL